MSPRAVSSAIIERPPVLHAGEEVGAAVRTVLDSGLAALPVVGGDERLIGIFGEREFIGAVFPGYLKELSYAGFVRKELDAALETRAACRQEPVETYANTEHVELAEDHSDIEIAETFLHHRVLLLPVIDADRRVVGVITRAAFFRAVAERFLAM